MANFEKHGKGAIGHLGLHFERGLGEDGLPVRYNNQAIDLSRSHLNFNLAPERNMNHAEYVQQRTSEVHCLNRADVKVLGTWVVTLPKGLEGQERDFFEKTYDFLQKRYGGENNVVSAYVHMDETSPHIHFAFIPVVDDPKKGLKVSMKECVNRKDLQTFHQDLEKELAKSFGREVGILNNATREGNKSIAELKRLTATNQVEMVKQEINNLEHHKNSLQGQIKAIESDIAKVSNVKLSYAQIDAIKGEIGLLNKNKVTLDVNDFNNLKETAKGRYLIENENEKLKFELRTKEPYVHAYEKTEKKNKDLNGEVQKYKRGYERLADFVTSKGLKDDFNEFEQQKKANEELQKQLKKQAQMQKGALDLER